MKTQIKQLLLGIASAALLVLAVDAQAQVSKVAEASVNSTATNSQQNPAVAADSSGNYVVVWESKDQDGDGWGIYMQRYNSSGSAQGSETLVNTTTAGDQRFPAVGRSATGDFVVAWMSDARMAMAGGCTTNATTAAVRLRAAKP